MELNSMSYSSAQKPPRTPDSTGKQALLYPSPPPQKASIFRIIPWGGIFALVLAIAAACGMAVILVLSDAATVDSWKVSPSVWLSIASTGANMMLHKALLEGVAVAWWVKALKPGTTIQDLHNFWSFGTLRRALGAGKSFNLVALATIVAAGLSPVCAPILQRASTVGMATARGSSPVTMRASLDWPAGYTGVITDQNGTVGFTTSNFSSIFQKHITAQPIQISKSGCVGQCTGIVQAAGYAISCNTSVSDFNFTSSDGTITKVTLNGTATNDTDIFHTSFRYIENHYYDRSGNRLTEPRPSLNFTSAVKISKGCSGTLNVTTCSLEPALLQYNVIFVNNTVTLNPRYTYRNDRVVQYNPAKGNTSPGSSTHGGFYLALDSLYNSSVNLESSGKNGYAMSMRGSAALQYSRINFDLDANMTSECSSYWFDPTDNIMAIARELAFRTSVTAANSTETQEINMAREWQKVTYRSNLVFMLIAICIILLCVILIAPIFWGFWTLDRRVTLSPVEIGRAFQAPVLETSRPDLGLDDILKETGNRPLHR